MRSFECVLAVAETMHLGTTPLNFITNLMQNEYCHSFPGQKERKDQDTLTKYLCSLGKQ